MNWGQKAREFRRDLHQIPELAFNEVKTSAYLYSALNEMGLTPRRLTSTGLVADIEGNRPGRTVALRADMDGLPLDEATGLAFSSRHAGVMHACGHDGHMAILLATAGELAEQREFAGRIRILFQPAEERPPGGAPAMIEAGALDGVDEILGLHLWAPIPVGTVAVLPGPFMANADEFVIRVRGRGGHGSEPETTQDAVLIAAQIVVNLQTIVSRRISAFEPAVVSCGTIRAGQTFNIIAEEAEVTGTVRTFSATVQEKIAQEIRHLAQTTAALYGAQAEIDYRYGYPAVVNHEHVVSRWEKALDGVVTVAHPYPSMGAEDFAYYLQKIPGAFLFVGARPEGQAFPHHSPHFQINEQALDIGREVLRRGALTALQAG